MGFLLKKKSKKYYFLRVKSNKKLFVHPDGENETELHYKIKKGKVGASIFTKKQAKLFCSDTKDLEMVRVLSQIKK